MKKLSKCCAFCALCLASFIFCACEKSNQDLLNDYQDLVTEMADAIENGNLIKVQEISKKGEKIEEELNKRDLSESEKNEKAKIEAEIVSAISGMSPF